MRKQILMTLSDDTYYGMIRKRIVEQADDSQITMVPRKFFGDLYVIGEKHSKAAKYLEEQLEKCQTKGAEIRLHLEVEEKFGVALYHHQSVEFKVK